MLFSPFHSLRTVKYPVKLNVDQRKNFSYDVNDTCFSQMLLRLNTIQRELDTEMDKENIQNLIVNSKVQGVTKAFRFTV